MTAVRCWFLPSLLIALGVHVPVCAHPTAAEIATTWTGLERASGVDATLRFTLVLQVDPAAALTAPSSRPGLPLAAQPGQKLTGTWTAQSIERDRRGRQAAPVVQNVTAEYFPDAGILRATRRPQTGGAGFDCLIVFDPEVKRLAGVYTGGLRNLMPFYAARGEALDPALTALTGLPREHVFAATPGGTAAADLHRALAEAYATSDYARVRAILDDLRRPAPGGAPANGAPSPAPAARNVEAEMLALNQQLQAAAARGDVAEIKRLQQEMQKLRAEAAAQRRNPPTPAPRPGSVPATGGCPEHIVAWASQLDTYGGSVAEMESNIHLANLFRPRLFAPYFGTTFAALTPEARATIGRDMQSRCVLDGTPLGRGSAIGALISAFQNTPGYNSTEAGLGGLALEVIADWNLRCVRDLGAELDAARVADFEMKSAQLVAHLFPRERDDTRQQLAALKSRNHGRRLLAELDSLGLAAASGNPEAMERLVQLPRYADAANLAAADRAPFDQRYATVFAESVIAFFARARAEALSPAPGLDLLIRGKAWLAANGDALNALRGQGAAEQFQRDFNAARAASYAAERARLTREIAALQTWDDLARYPVPFEIFSDTTTSFVWQEIDAQRRAKLAAIERKEFLARTGDGPFGPEYPGAIYLNALWRNDQALIEKLDERYRAPFLAQLGMLEQVDYTPDLAEKLTGNTGSADRHRRLRRALLEEASLANVLLVMFAFDYEEDYPACMDAEPVEFRVHVQRERIVRNLMGHYLRSVPDGVDTITHRVNHRHSSAVADLRIADPNDTVLGEALFGRIDRDTSYVHVGTGLAQAMREHACDSEVIRRIETGLLARWESYAERKDEIRQRILGSRD